MARVESPDKGTLIGLTLGGGGLATGLLEVYQHTAASADAAPAVASAAFFAAVWIAFGWKRGRGPKY